MPDNDSRKYDIRIGTQYEGSAAKEAVSDENALTEATERATAAGAEQSAGAADAADAVTQQGQSAAQAATNAVNFGQTLREGTQIVRILSSAARGGATSVRGLTGALRGLWRLASANPLALLVTALTAVVSALGAWIRKSIEAREQIAKDIDDTVKKNADAAAEIAKVAGQAKFDGLKSELAAISDRFERINKDAAHTLELARNLEDARLGAELARLDKEETTSLLAAQGNPVKEAEIRSDFAQRRLVAKQENDALKANEELKAARAEAERIEAEQRETSAKIAEASGETPSQKALRENREAVQGAAKELGIRTTEEQQLDELERLRKKRDTPSEFGLPFSSTDAVSLLELELKEPQLRKNAQTSTSFNSDQLAAATGDAARIREFRERAEFFQGRAGDSKNPDRKMDDWIARGAAAQLKKAEAARTIVEFSNQPDAQDALKKQADADEKSRKEILDSNAKKQAELDDKRKAAAGRLQLAEAKQVETSAQSDTAIFKAKTDGERAIQEKRLEEQKKFVDAQIKVAQAELEKTDKLTPVYDKRARNLASLEQSKVGLRLPGTEPTTADAAAEFAEKARIDADLDKRLTEASQARDRENDRRMRAEDRFNKSKEATALREKGVGISSQVAGAAEATPVGTMRPALDLVNSINAEFAANPFDAGVQERLIAALKLLSQNFFANKQQLSSLESQMTAFEQAVEALRQQKHDSY